MRFFLKPLQKLSVNFFNKTTDDANNDISKFDENFLKDFYRKIAKRTRIILMFLKKNLVYRFY